LPAILAVIAPCALAKTVYVRDTLYVPLRGGESPEYRILHRGIRSGTKLELLAQDDESGYSLVRMEDGLEGYIQTQYLVDQPIARALLEQTEERLVELEATHQQTLVRNLELTNRNDELEEELASLQSAYEGTTRELEQIQQLAANVISIDEQNAQLAQEREMLEREIDDLLIANDNLEDRAAQEWFVRGGGVVVVALLLGFWVARRIYNRRTSGWS
jgi:SH3 domain protein